MSGLIDKSINFGNQNFFFVDSSTVSNGQITSIV